MKISALQHKRLLHILNFLALPLVGQFMKSLPKEYLVGFSAPVFILAFAFSIFIHECIHFFFLKLFDSSANTYLGFKSFCPYAMSRGGFYTKSQIIVALLAPFVLVNSLLILLYFAGIIPVGYAVLLLVGHSWGCLGDFLMTWQTSKVPTGYLITDVPDEVSFMAVASKS